VPGPSRDNRTTRPPERADALAEIVLLDHDGREVRLGDLWSERTVALVWLRHYG
jgi:prostamide/prostaglandin F2alpha synthase